MSLYAGGGGGKLYIWVTPWDQIEIYKQTNKHVHDDYQVMMVNLLFVVVVGGSVVVGGVVGVGVVVVVSETVI